MGFNIMRAGLKGLESPSSAVTLQSGQSATLPSGQYLIQLGKYSVLQYYDPVSLTWRNFMNGGGGNPFPFSSDGSNYRIINLTGTVCGGVVTTLGTSTAALEGTIWPAGSSSVTGVTATVAAPANAPTVTAQLNVIVGGAVSKTVTVTAGGSGYVMPPILTFSAPPAGGLRATGYAVVTAGAVSSVVITNQGAGYKSAPTITVTPSIGDLGVNAVLTAALVPSSGTTIGYGQITAVTVANYGGGYATVPTVTVASSLLAGSPAVTAVCCFSVVTAPTLSSATHYGNIVNQVVFPAQRTAAVTGGSMLNPDYSTNLYQMRNGLAAPGTSASLASLSIIDGGMSQLDVSNLPTVMWSSDGTIPAAFTSASGASGGAVTDISWVIPY